MVYIAESRKLSTYAAIFRRTAHSCVRIREKRRAVRERALGRGSCAELSADGNSVRRVREMNCKKMDGETVLVSEV